MDITKQCSRCKELRLLCSFNKESTSKDGYRSSCRTCDKISRSANKTACRIDGCNKISSTKGLCSAHYKRQRLGKDMTTPVAVVAPKGGGYTDTEGYRRIGKQKVHRMVMEQILGRKLLPHENVHHKNGDRQDNAPDNLELWVNHQPKGARVEDQVKHALKILQTYRPDLLRGN